MPYDTRRKSLSLSSLGIHVPTSKPASSKSATANVKTSPTMSPKNSRSSSSSEDDLVRPSKKTKRSHDSNDTSKSTISKGSKPVKFETTPPPSPGLHMSIEEDGAESLALTEMRNINLGGINDEIVEAVIVRLQESRNRPHLVKELATVLMNQRAIATPSLSSSTSTSEDAESADNDRRRELSLSPEVDLSSPEFDDMEEDVPMPGTPMGSVSLSRHRTATSISKQKDEPPLEKDEREFTQTADGLQKRKLSGSLLSVNPVEHIDMYDGVQNDLLFGEPKGLSLAPSLLPHMVYITSPAMRPSLAVPTKKEGEAEGWSKLDAMLDWDRSPETVELEELDCLLDDF
ncbi:mucin [Seiridium cupressi]